MEMEPDPGGSMWVCFLWSDVIDNPAYNDGLALLTPQLQSFTNPIDHCDIAVSAK